MANLDILAAAAAAVLSDIDALTGASTFGEVRQIRQRVRHIANQAKDAGIAYDFRGAVDLEPVSLDALKTVSFYGNCVTETFFFCNLVRRISSDPSDLMFHVAAEQLQALSDADTLDAVSQALRARAF